MRGTAHPSILKGSLALILVGLLSGPAWPADAKSILQKMDEALRPGKDMRARVRFTLFNPLDEETRWHAQYYRHGGEDARIRFVFTEPADRRGIELLVQRVPDGLDELQIYLPALRRSRTIRLPFRGTTFLHTDFNYADLGFVELSSAKHELRGEKTIDGRDCYRIESHPRDTWWYERVVRFVDKEHHLPLRTEYFFDPAGTSGSDVPYKVKTLGGIRTIDSYPTPTTVIMRTIEDDTRTRLDFTNVEYDTSLPAKATQSPFAGQ